MLTERYDIDFLRLHMLPHGEWTPFPPARDREVAAYRDWAQQRQEYFRKSIHRLDDFAAGQPVPTTLPIRWEGVTPGRRGIPARDRALVLARANQLRTQIAGWTAASLANGALSTARCNRS